MRPRSSACWRSIAVAPAATARPISSSNADEGESGAARRASGGAACRSQEGKACDCDFCGAGCGAAGIAATIIGLAITQDCLRAGTLLNQERFERRANEIVPAACRPLPFAFGAADDQPVGGSCHRHVEQSPIFVFGLGQRDLPRGRDRGSIVRLPSRPDRPRAANGQEARVPRSGGRRHGIGENDDRRFQPLGAVHGHDPHLVAGDLHVALHFGARLAEPSKETLQRRRFAALVVEREIEEFIERIVRLVAETRHEIAAARRRGRAVPHRTRTAPCAALPAPACAGVHRRS